jgi:hypothetical protein
MYPPRHPGTAPLRRMTEPTPSLVSQLQQVHGLTKKKVYSTRPARQPFCKEERFDQESNEAPSLVGPSSGGGRLPSLSKSGRTARIAQKAVIGHSNPYPTRSALARRNSSISSSSSEVTNRSSPPSYMTPTPSPTTLTHSSHHSVQRGRHSPQESWAQQIEPQSSRRIPTNSYPDCALEPQATHIFSHSNHGGNLFTGHGDHAGMANRARILI